MARMREGVARMRWRVRSLTMRTFKLEHDEQAHVIRWAEWKQREIPALRNLFAVPNGGHRNLLVARKMKREGVRPGVPDMFLAAARGPHHGLFIEMKTEEMRPKRGGKGGCTDHQIAWQTALRSEGYRVEVCYGAREGIAVIEDYLLNG